MAEADQCGCMIAVITHTLLIVVDSCCGRFNMMAASRTMPCHSTAPSSGLCRIENSSVVLLLNFAGQQIETRNSFVFGETVAQQAVRVSRKYLASSDYGSDVRFT